MSRLSEIRDRLDRITEQLASEQTTDAVAAELAAEAARLTGEAAEEASAAIARLEQES
jgi:F420-0:gamma-glutamyl ligase